MNVLESAEYGDDVRRVAQDPDIIDMAEALKASGEVEKFLADPDASRLAYREAQNRLVDFKFIGTPYRAIVLLLTGTDPR